MRHRRMTQRVLERAVAQRFLDGQFVAIVLTNQTEVFGQTHQLGTGVSRLIDQLQGLVKVGLGVLARNHLNGGDFHVRSLRGGVRMAWRGARGRGFGPIGQGRRCANDAAP